MTPLHCGRFAKTIFTYCAVMRTRALGQKLGKRCNLGDGEGMQVPCKLSLSGQPKFVSLLRKELMKMKEI